MRFRRHRDQPIEELLRANRPEPRPELVASIVDRVEAERGQRGRRGLGRRLALAAALTALAVGGAVVAGASSSVSVAAGDLASAVRNAFTPTASATHAAAPAYRISLTTEAKGKAHVNVTKLGSGSTQVWVDGTHVQGDPIYRRPHLPADDQYSVPVCLVFHTWYYDPHLHKWVRVTHHLQLMLPPNLAAIVLKLDPLAYLGYCEA